MGDAYGYTKDEDKADYGYRPKAPVTDETRGSVMYSWNSANANDIEMVLQAFKTNKWQGFTTYSAWGGIYSGTKSSVIRSYDNNNQIIK